MKRVVSLLPSATEILDRVGGIAALVGRSHECDFPEGLGEIPVLTAPRTVYDPESGVGAAEVDAQVRAAMEAKKGSEAGTGRTGGSGPDSGGESSDDGSQRDRSLYTLDTDRLVELAPDVILTQNVCEVCSIDLDSVRAAAKRVGEATGRTPAVIALDSETIEGVWDDHLLVGRAVGREPEAAQAVFEMRSRWIAAESFVNPYTEGPVVGFLEWTDPLFVAGHWTAQMIERAGGRHPLNACVPRENMGAAAGMQAGQRVAGKSIRVSPEAFAATRPEYLVVCPCGLTLEQAVAETEKLAAEAAWWGDLPAVQKGRVAVVDGNQMFNRPGPRLVEAFEWLAGWLNGRGEMAPAGFEDFLVNARSQ